MTKLQHIMKDLHDIIIQAPYIIKKDFIYIIFNLYDSPGVPYLNTIMYVLGRKRNSK